MDNDGGGVNNGNARKFLNIPLGLGLNGSDIDNSLGVDNENGSSTFVGW
ncbi:MAG: hypothetical protein CM15mP51_25240 [Porticoccaceae bacterium]|nr:MAG: hypothetical protein CM15mP51_25240 [Porticoccaceae bacterium]